MPLTIAPSEGFDSFVSVAEADAYHAAMGNAGWTGDDAAKESALRRATQYIDARYPLKPDAVDPVHRRLAEATSELALRALAGPLQKDGTGKPAVTEKTIGPLTTKYAAPVNDGQPSYPVVDALLRGLTAGGRNTIRVVRA